MRYSSVLFDFDGTICNTGEGIMKSAQYALTELGYDTPADFSTLSYFVGPPLTDMFCEKFGASAKESMEFLQKFRERYNDIGLYESHLYPHIESLLIALKKDGIKTAIASSKPEKYIKELLFSFGIDGYFDVVCGIDFNNEGETKSSVISRCVEKLNDNKENILMIGDRKYDIEGAKQNGIDSVGVLWGYGSYDELQNAGANFIVDKPQDVESVALEFFEQTIEQKSIFEGRIIHVHHDSVKMVDGKIQKREVVDHPGGVAIAGLTDNNELLLVRQFRYPYKETIYEIPAGKLEKGEDPFAAGVREFSEECGAKAQNIFSLGCIYPSPGYCSEIIYLYGATNLSFGKKHLDEDEFLDVIRMPFDTVIEKIVSGEIKDSKTIAAAFKLKEMRK